MKKYFIINLCYSPSFIEFKYEKVLIKTNIHEVKNYDKEKSLFICQDIECLNKLKHIVFEGSLYRGKNDKTLHRLAFIGDQIKHYELERITDDESAKLIFEVN